MKQVIDEYLELKAAMVKQMRKYVMNKNIPLSERWELFLKSDLGNCSPWYMDSRFVDFSGYYSSIEKHVVNNSEEFIIYLENKEVPVDVIDNVKEEILEAFNKSYTYYW